MIFKNLQSYINELSKRNDLVRIDVPVDPHLELAEIHRRVIAANGPALLFTNIKGKNFPVATNLFGTHDRILLAFGNHPLELVKHVAKIPEELLPPSIKKLWGLRSTFKKLAKIGFKPHKQSPVFKYCLQPADLTALPTITSWEKDGGPFLTLPLVHTQGFDGKPDNLGMYRIQIHEAHEAGMHFQIGKGGGFHLYEAEQRGVELPVNIYLGGPPALTLSAIAPLPENVPELMLASLIMGEKIARGKSSQCTIDPIAEAEFCLTGIVPPGIRRPEGPFGDHYGYYSLIHDYPVFRPSAIFHRERAIFPATVVGKPRQEDFYLGDFLQELLSPLFPLAMPGVKDLWSYGETGYHALSAAVLKERYGRESMASVFRILGEGQLSLTKFLLATDTTLDLKDFTTVFCHILERVQWHKDLFIFSELSMDSLDYAGPEINKGSKGVILGLGPAIRTLPKETSFSNLNSIIKNIKVFCPGCLVVEIPSYLEDAACIKEIAIQQEFSNWPIIIAVNDAEKATKTEAAFLWTAFTRFEPAADIYSAKTTIKQNHVCHEGPIVIDARMKPWYPEELFCDPKTKSVVDNRWKEYFPNKNIEMGSSDDAHLYSKR
ncbi:MAG: UbiD family decarboxylase [Bdellovibrionota bacterium]